MMLYSATLLLSSFLLFLVQPIVGKQIVPWFGGTAAVWSTCLVFFQLALLAGYAYSDRSSRLRAATQSSLHIALLLLSLASLPILVDASWKPHGDEDPQVRIVCLLAATIGLPYFLLSTTSPLLQSWIAREHVDAATAQRVYRFFALSNVGSLLGLLSYPFVIEPQVATRTQAIVWSLAYALYTLLAIACALRARRSAATSVAAEKIAAATESEPAATPQATAPDLPPRARDFLRWFVLSCLSSVLLLSVSNHLTQNVASIPFLWVLPLALYLLSFVLVFEGRGGRGYYLRAAWIAPTLILLALMAWGLVERSGLLKLSLAIPLYSLGLLASCTFCHGELAATKPASRYLTRFYLLMSLGGAAGGLLVSLLAPKLFVAYLELPLALLFCALLALWLTWPRHRILGGATRPAIPLSRVALTRRALPWLAPLLALSTALFCGHYLRAFVRDVQKRNVFAARNFYGVLRVVQSAPDSDPKAVRRLLHGAIIHGEQHLDPARRSSLMSYFGKTSGLGLALRRAPSGPRRIGVLGLGVGTIAAYGRAGDTFRMYEINPQVLQVASRYFFFLSESKAQIQTVLGDARLVLEREAPQQFDVLAVDAFSGDSIPIHLLTQEALRLYLRHIKPDGVLAFNVTNRYVNVAPVLQKLASDAGYPAFLISDDAEDDIHDDLFQSDWVIVSKNAALLADEELLQRSTPIPAIPGLRSFTDDFSHLFQILK